MSSSTTAEDKIRLAPRYHGCEKSIWVEYVGLANQYKAVNLGQGFPDYLAPDTVRTALSKATLDAGNPLTNQYTRGFGHPKLVEAISKVYSHTEFHDRKLDPSSEILVTCGAYEALFCAFQSLVHPGDEVVIIEPFFDCYEPMTRTAGGVPKFVALKPNAQGDWGLDPTEVAAAFSDKTKILVLNTPNNPLGKIYTHDELVMLAGLCIRHDVICLSDDVYEWMNYDPRSTPRARMANVEGMWPRTITVGSAGKTFSVTGWKLGWAIAPPHLMRCLQIAHQNCTYTCNTPVQLAVAEGFEIELGRRNRPDCYLTSLAEIELKPKRDAMAAVLKAVGLKPVVPEGGYFMVADFSPLFPDHDFSDVTNPLKDDQDSEDVRLVKWLTINHKLATIPVSCFYSKQHRHLARSLIRFCFIKDDETIDKAKAILSAVTNWKNALE